MLDLLIVTFSPNAKQDKVEFGRRTKLGFCRIGPCKPHVA